MMRKLLCFTCVFVIMCLIGIGYHANHSLTVSTEDEVKTLTFGDTKMADANTLTPEQWATINYALNPNYETKTAVSGIGTPYAPPTTDTQTVDYAAQQAAATTAANNAYLDDQANQLRDLLARTGTYLSQGNEKIASEYNKELGNANLDKEKQLTNYGDQRTAQNQNKVSTYGTINKNANNGYRSLAQIIGRASGVGSSAYLEALPNAVGTDTSSKRRAATETFGKNLQGIDKSQNEYLSSFEQVLQDLLDQKKANEEQLASGVETQRQGINSQLATNAATKAQNAGGGYAAVQAAIAPYSQAIQNSRNAVDTFFNQFKPSYTPQKAAAATPELAAYTTDRSAVNAGQQGVDPTNPYAQLLRKKLQGQA
jgi:hypothetical protein